MSELPFRFAVFAALAVPNRNPGRRIARRLIEGTRRIGVLDAIWRRQQVLL